MRVLLISANAERINMACLPVGLGLVAGAARRAGHEVRFLDLLHAADPLLEVRKAIEAFSPEAIGISVRNVDDQDMRSRRFLLEPVRDLVAACRASSRAPIVLGGAGYSMFPEAALAYLGADFGVCGEGEAPFVRLLTAIDKGEDPFGLPGVYVAGRGCGAGRSFVEDLDVLAPPVEDLWQGADPNSPDLWVPVQTRRGCPLDCNYCSTAQIEGRALRAMSPGQVVEHLARVVEAGFRKFYLVDNTFNLPPSYALELCRRITARRLEIQWRCILYPHQVPEELIAAMAEAGCVEVSLGFESGARPVLRAMNKRFEPEEVREISERLAAHGIRRMGFLLLGGPGETRETVRESLAFADSLRLDLFKTSVGIRIYPHTPLARTAVEEGLIAPDDDLLSPRFYVRPELAEWLDEIVPP